MDDILAASSSKRDFIKNFRKHLDDVKKKARSDSEKTETSEIARFLQTKGLTSEFRQFGDVRNILANDLQEHWKDMYQSMKLTCARDDMPEGVSDPGLDTRTIAHTHTGC